MASYLVTGSSRGLGLATVTFLASLPKTDVGVVFATARSQTPALKALIEISSLRVVFIAMDTTDQASVENGVKNVEKHIGSGGLDVLINNAGTGGFSEGWTTQMTDLNEEFNVNVTGTHIVTTKFLPLLRKGQTKKIVNIGSTMGSLALADKFAVFPLPAYKVSKAALNALTVQWAQALAGDGFVVISLNPGSVKTAMGGGDFADLTLEQGAKGVVEAIIKADSRKNGTFFMIEVAGWENSAGIHQYDGKVCPW